MGKMTMIDIEKDAKDLLSKAKAEREGMSKAEPKGAAPAPSAEIKKTEGETEAEQKAKVDAEAKIAKEKADAEAKKDEELAAKKDEELNEADKARKAEIVKSKLEVDKKTGFQKRIDELQGKILSLENDRQSTKAERDAVKAELDAVKKRLNMTPQDEVREKVKNESLKRHEKYLAEDKTLPREDRREMSKEEYDEWMAENPDEAQEWRERRTYRRAEEERDIKIDLEQTTKAEEILDKQQESARRTYAKYPELKIESRRTELLKQGKPREEINKILCDEIPKYKLAVEIYQENPTKYMLSENGPELIAEELEKRLGKNPAKDPKIEELEKKLAEKDAEIERLSGLDVEVSSTRHAEPKTSEPEIVKKTEELGNSLGLSKDQVKKALERRKGVR